MSAVNRQVAAQVGGLYKAALTARMRAGTRLFPGMNPAVMLQGGPLGKGFAAVRGRADIGVFSAMKPPVNA